MEIIEVTGDHQGFLTQGGFGGDGQNVILQGFSPAQFINDGGGGGFELIEEFPTTDGQTSYVQVVEPNPTVIVNYIIGANGSLIPVYDSFPVDNTVTIVTGTAEPFSEPSVPPHILDHMYAKKPKEPGTETATKPRKRAKKKEPPPPVMQDLLITDIMSPNTTKVNIIRKGQNTTSSVSMPSLSSTMNAFRPVITSRPKILQNTKTTSPQKVGGNVTSDLLPTARLSASIPLTRTLTASPSPSSSATSPLTTPLVSDPLPLDIISEIPKDVAEATPSTQVYLDFFALDDLMA